MFEGVLNIPLAGIDINRKMSQRGSFWMMPLTLSRKDVGVVMKGRFKMIFSQKYFDACTNIKLQG